MAWSDSDTGRKDGFIATYQEVVVALPRSGPNLRDVLVRQESETLGRMCVRLGVRHSPNDRDTRLRLLLARLSERGFCRAVVGSLSPEARDLFMQIRAASGRMDIEAVAKRTKTTVASYRSPIPLGYIYTQPEIQLQGPVQALVARGLLVVIASDPYGGRVTALGLPEEVDGALSEKSVFDTVDLAPPPLVEATEVRGKEPEPLRVLRDLAHLVGYAAAGRCEWKQDGQPYQRSLQGLGKALQAKDRGYPDMLWDLAQGTGLLRGGPQAARAAATMEWPDPDELFRRVLRAWARGYSASPLGYSRPFMTTMRRTRLLSVLAEVPNDVWIRRDSYERFIQSRRPLLFGADDTLTAEVRGDLDSIRSLVLAVGVGAGKNDAIMVPSLVEPLLLDGRDGDPALPPWDDSWIVQADRTVIVAPNVHPRVIVDLWGMADLEQNQEAAVFRLTPSSVAAALNRGVTPEEINALLARRSRAPIPDGVLRLVEDQGRRYGRIRVGPAQAYVRSEDPGLIEELVHSRKLAQLSWRHVAPGVAIVEGSAAHVVLGALRQAGFLPVLENREKAASGNGTSKPAPGRSSWTRRVAALLNRAKDGRVPVHLRWREGTGTRRALIRVVQVGGSHLDALDFVSNDYLAVDLDTVEYAQLHNGAAGGLVDGYDDDDDDEED
jgi:hypothetical protein